MLCCPSSNQRCVVQTIVLVYIPSIWGQILWIYQQPYVDLPLSLNMFMLTSEDIGKRKVKEEEEEGGEKVDGKST